MVEPKVLLRELQEKIDRPGWSALTVEKPLDPLRGIIDAHHHLWDHPKIATYLAAEFVADARSGHNITDSVYVESKSFYHRSGPQEFKPIGETEFAAQQSTEAMGLGTRIAAIVAFADLTLGDAVAEVLQAHDVAGRGRFRGVRYGTTWDADPLVRLASPDTPALMATKSFRSGVACLGRAGYSFDAWVYHPQLGEVVALARATEETTIVLDHLGGPLGIGPYTDRDATRADWRAGLAQLASCPNVFLKLDGIGMDNKFGMGWSDRICPPGSDEVSQWWSDDIRWCVDRFGPDRCMFASNYPVDRQSLGYTVLWNALQKIAAPYSDGEQDSLFAQTAKNVYRID